MILPPECWRITGTAANENHREDDPWQECAAVGTGGITVAAGTELHPEELLRRIRISYMIQDAELSELLIARRCMNGKLYTCRIGTENRCFDQPDLTTEPNPAMKQVCEELKDGILADAVLKFPHRKSVFYMEAVYEHG